MKILMSALLVGGTSLLSASGVALAASNVETVEVPISEAFIPSKGYDDNDNVEALLSGVLPNDCYQIANTTREQLPNNEIHVHQFAYRLHDDICGQTDDDVPDSYRGQVPYATTLSLGHLDAGSYAIWFQGDVITPTFLSPFEVDQAPTSYVDDFPYVSVTNVYVREGVPIGTQPTALITGLLTSTCMDLPSQLEVQNQGSVIVILPKMVSANRQCARSTRPFERSVPLGMLAAGRYMVQVRSAGGQAAQTTFSVLLGARD